MPGRRFDPLTLSFRVAGVAASLAAIFVSVVSVTQSKEGDVDTSGSFTARPAPCGRVVDGESFQDQDAEIVVTRETDFSCGCRTIQHEYHDGTVSRRVIRHDGVVLVDEMVAGV
jgi:hypothetical protein